MKIIIFKTEHGNHISHWPTHRIVNKGGPYGRLSWYGAALTSSLLMDAIGGEQNNEKKKNIYDIRQRNCHANIVTRGMGMGEKGQQIAS